MFITLYIKIYVNISLEYIAIKIMMYELLS